MLQYPGHIIRDQTLGPLAGEPVYHSVDGISKMSFTELVYGPGTGTDVGTVVCTKSLDRKRSPLLEDIVSFFNLLSAYVSVCVCVCVHVCVCVCVCVRA